MPAGWVSAQVVFERKEPDAVERVRRYFVRQQFQLGELVGTSFSISSPPERMEGLFRGFRRIEQRGGELPLDAIPAEVRGAIAAVVVDEPPAFGPGNP
jgi:hypothetical protein